MKERMEEQMKELLALTENVPLEQAKNSEPPPNPLPALETATNQVVFQETADMLDSTAANDSLYQKLVDNISKLHEGKLFWERQSVDIGGVLSIVSARVVESYEREVTLEQRYADSNYNWQESMREIRTQLDEANDAREQLRLKLKQYTTVFGEVEPKGVKGELDSIKDALASSRKSNSDLEAQVAELQWKYTDAFNECTRLKTMENIMKSEVDMFHTAQLKMGENLDVAEATLSRERMRCNELLDELLVFRGNFDHLREDFKYQHETIPTLLCERDGLIESGNSCKGEIAKLSQQLLECCAKSTNLEEKYQEARLQEREKRGRSL